MKVWTDGACSGTPGIGGWAWATEDGRQGSGHAPSTTSQRMELTAALEAALTLEDDVLTIASDSAYVVNCFKERWYVSWQRNAWRTSTRKPVANQDLWEPLIDVVLFRRVDFIKVKGHSGDKMNDLVDQLAVAAKFSRGLR